MQMALEALNRAKPACFADTTITAIDDAITALRQALVDVDDTSQKRVDGNAKREHEWVGLTEKEVKAIANKRNDYGLPMTGRMWVFVADLTDKLKEKNHG